jgi:MoxR-like ATPase
MNDQPNNVEFECPQCKVRLKVPANLIGQECKCPQCSQVSTVPAPAVQNQIASKEVSPVPPTTATSPSEQTHATTEEPSANPTPFYQKQASEKPPEEMVGVDTPTRKLYQRISEEVAKIFVGQDELVQGTLVALFSGGHVLIESVPGLGKTLFVRLLGKILGCEFGRIQFTADLMPSDITGAPIFNMKTQEFDFRPGPVFTQLLLADEINRSPAKTHAALLEIMQEKHVTIDGTTHELDLPFLVVATQNPIESEGTYNLPEAQLDRFMLKLVADYPTESEEAEILNMHGGQFDLEARFNDEIQQVTTPEEIVQITQDNGNVRIDPLLVDYINKIVRLTRQWPQFYMGASPRAGIGLIQGARTLAAFYGRDYAVPDDVVQIAIPALRHRVSLTAEAEVEGQTVDQLLDELIRTIEVPRLKN